MSRRMIAALALLFALTTFAQAQQGRRFGRRGFENPVVSLASMAAVQQEIRLDEQQRALIDALRDDLRDQIRGVFVAARERAGDGDESRRRGFEETRATIDKINKQGEQLVAMILEPKQAERLAQIRLQREGTRAWERKELIAALELTEVQLEKIRETRQATFRNPFGEQQRVSFQQRRQQRAKLDADLVAILTDAQRAKWQKMKGKEFKFPERFPRIGRRARPEQE